MENKNGLKPTTIFVPVINLPLNASTGLGRFLK